MLFNNLKTQNFSPLIPRLNLNRELAASSLSSNSISSKLYYKVVQHKHIFQELDFKNLNEIRVKLAEALIDNDIEVEPLFSGKHPGCIVKDKLTGERVFIKEKEKNMITLYYNHLFYLMGIAPKNATALKKDSSADDKFVYIIKDEGYSVKPNNRAFTRASDLYRVRYAQPNEWNYYEDNFLSSYESIERMFQIQNIGLKNQGVIMKRNIGKPGFTRKSKVIDFKPPSPEHLIGVIENTELSFVYCPDSSLFKVSQRGRFLAPNQRTHQNNERGNFLDVKNLALKQSLRDYCINYNIELSDSKIENIEAALKDGVKEYYRLKRTSMFCSRENANEINELSWTLEVCFLKNQEIIKKILSKEKVGLIGSEEDIIKFSKNILEILMADLYVETLNSKVIEYENFSSAYI